jgi:hypothetical protein
MVTDDTDRIKDWHQLYLLKLGYGREDAQQAADEGVDPHLAERLLEQGCPRELALAIARD